MPTELGKDVSLILVANFPDLFNVDFTAFMENELDKVASGDDEYEKVLDSFYKPLEAALSLRKSNPIVPQNSEPEKCEKCGEGSMVVKWTASGKFFGCSCYPKCKNIIKAKPTGRICELCQSLMMEGTKTIPERCSNKLCPNHNPHKLNNA